MISNLNILLSIVNESHQLMIDLLEQGRTPKEGGGYILQTDPEKSNFKEVFEILIFVGA
jgi:hypothetical protein